MVFFFRKLRLLKVEILFFVLFLLLCTLLLESSFLGRILFLLGFVTTVLFPGWSLASVLAQDTSPIHRVALALLLGLTIPPYILFVGSFLFHLPVSLPFLLLISGGIIFLSLLYRFFQHVHVLR